MLGDPLVNVTFVGQPLTPQVGLCHHVLLLTGQIRVPPEFVFSRCYDFSGLSEACKCEMWTQLIFNKFVINDGIKSIYISLHF